MSITVNYYIRQYDGVRVGTSTSHYMGLTSTGAIMLPDSILTNTPKLFVISPFLDGNNASACAPGTASYPYTWGKRMNIFYVAEGTYTNYNLTVLQNKPMQFNFGKIVNGALTIYDNFSDTSNGINNAVRISSTSWQTYGWTPTNTNTFRDQVLLTIHEVLKASRALPQNQREDFCQISDWNVLIMRNFLENVARDDILVLFYAGNDPYAHEQITLTS